VSWSCQLNDNVDRYESVASIDAYIATVTAQLAKANAGLAAQQQMTRPSAGSGRWKGLAKRVGESAISGIGAAVSKLWENAVTIGILAIGGLALAWVKNHLG
jgi:hypothetical protein